MHPDRSPVLYPHSESLSYDKVISLFYYSKDEKDEEKKAGKISELKDQVTTVTPLWEYVNLFWVRYKVKEAGA